MASYNSTLTIDTTNLRNFARKLREADPLIRTTLRRSLKEAGEIVAVEARVLGGSRAGEIRVRTSGVGVRVVAGIGQEAPHAGKAAAFENKGVPGAFRHPVFGNRQNWVSQNAHPFLAPALEAKAEPVALMVGEAIETALGAFLGSIGAL